MKFVGFLQRQKGEPSSIMHPPIDILNHNAALMWPQKSIESRLSMIQRFVKDDPYSAKKFIPEALRLLKELPKGTPIIPWLYVQELSQILKDRGISTSIISDNIVWDY